MRSALTLSLILLGACGPSVQNGGAASDVRLAIDADEVAAGSTVELALHNGSSGAVGYNLCTSVLERETDGGWEAVPSDRVCTMELRTLAAGESTRYPYEVPASLAPGSYRFLVNVEMMDAGSRRSVWSDPFILHH